MIYLFGKLNHTATTYQKSSYYCTVHFFATRQKEQLPSQISVIDIHFRFSNLAYNMHPEEEHKSINEHYYHSFLKHYHILVCHNYYKFYPHPIFQQLTQIWIPPPYNFLCCCGLYASDLISISAPYPLIGLNDNIKEGFPEH